MLWFIFGPKSHPWLVVSSDITLEEISLRTSAAGEKVNNIIIIG